MMGCDRAPLAGSNMIGAMHPSICRPVAEVLVGESGDAAHSAPSTRTGMLFHDSLLSFCIRSTDTCDLSRRSDRASGRRGDATLHRQFPGRVDATVRNAVDFQPHVRWELG